MADRYAACIRIGGQLSRTKQILPDDPGDDTTIIQGLIGALNDDSASHEYGDATIPTGCSEEELFDRYFDEDEGVLIFKTDQAVNGEFEETEIFCAEERIPFDRWCDHYCEYDAENVHFRPGMDKPLVTLANSDGNEIVCGQAVRKALEKLCLFEVGSPRRDWDDLAVGIGLLHDACPMLPEKLQKFEMIA